MIAGTVATAKCPSVIIKVSRNIAEPFKLTLTLKIHLKPAHNPLVAPVPAVDNTRGFTKSFFIFIANKSGFKWIHALYNMTPSQIINQKPIWW